MNAPSFTASGVKSTQKAVLPKDIFELKVENQQLLKESYEAYLAKGRSNNAVVKTRGLVRGGGRKPWRQKGTGRARFGSSRNPIWRGGGIVFGPTGQENYVKNINVKAKRLALRQALSLAASDNKVFIIEDLKLKAPKTKDLAKLLTKLGLKDNCLIVVDAISSELNLSSRNISQVKLSRARSLNVFDVLNADSILFTKSSISELSKRLETK